MWTQAAKPYQTLIQSSDWDSAFLRNEGVKPNLQALIGDCRNASLLDAGTGTGWLFEWLRPKQAFACDVYRPAGLPGNVTFQFQDVQNLDYEPESFDIVVASLLLMFCSDSAKALGEFHRVCRPGGKLVVALTHPYFYRTGVVTEDGSFQINQNLKESSEFEIEIAGQVGPLTYYYRPLSDYINQSLESGWRIQKFLEWFIDQKQYDAALSTGVRSKIKRTSKVPLYCFLSLTKS